MGLKDYISTHDLTKRSTADATVGVGRELISTHDLTKRSTPLSGFRSRSCGYFNSRPHEEVDCWLLGTCPPRQEFQLTTSRRGRPHAVKDGTAYLIHFNSRPHEEVDDMFCAGGVCNHISTHDLTKRSTAPQTGRRSIRTYFNSRPHEEVDDLVLWLNAQPTIFQLTTSRRGRRSCL